jgi:hypothetical protein
MASDRRGGSSSNSGRSPESARWFTIGLLQLDNRKESAKSVTIEGKDSVNGALIFVSRRLG